MEALPVKPSACILKIDRSGSQRVAAVKTAPAQFAFGFSFSLLTTSVPPDTLKSGFVEGIQHMKVTLVPSSIATGDEHPSQYLISYLINDALAIDAGSLGLYGTPQQQAMIKHVLITHTHIDHTATLPIFLENAYEAQVRLRHDLR